MSNVLVSWSAEVRTDATALEEDFGARHSNGDLFVVFTSYRAPQRLSTQLKLATQCPKTTSNRWRL